MSVKQIAGRGRAVVPDVVTFGGHVELGRRRLQRRQVERQHGVERHPGARRDVLGNRHPPPRWREVDRRVAVLDRPAAEQLIRQRDEQLLGELHEVFVGGVGPVELEHGELGIVAHRDALVAEVAVDLEDALEAADQQPLEVQLRRDAQEEIHVEGVVMRDERPRRGAAGQRLHHRRLDLDEVARREEGADALDDARAHDEHLAHLRIGDQIEVALPVARLDVGQSVPLLRQRTQGFPEQADLLHLDGQLVGLGAERAAADAGEVADVHQLEEWRTRPRRRRRASRRLGCGPVRSCRWRKEALPKSRIATMRPATLTVSVPCSSCSRVWLPYRCRTPAAVSAGRKSFGKGLTPRPRSSSSLRRRAATRSEISASTHLVPPSARGLTGMAGGVKEAELRIVDFGLRIDGVGRLVRNPHSAIRNPQ